MPQSSTGNGQVSPRHKQHHMSSCYEIASAITAICTFQLLLVLPQGLFPPVIALLSSYPALPFLSHVLTAPLIVSVGRVPRRPRDRSFGYITERDLQVRGFCPTSAAHFAALEQSLSLAFSGSSFGSSVIFSAFRALNVIDLGCQSIRIYAIPKTRRMVKHVLIKFSALLPCRSICPRRSDNLAELWRHDSARRVSAASFIYYVVRTKGSFQRSSLPPSTVINLSVRQKSHQQSPPYHDQF